MFRLLFACAIYLLAAVSNAAAQEASGAPQSLEAFRQQVDDVLKAAPGAPSAGIVLYEDGNVAWEGSIGIADSATGRAADADTHYRIGSVTKMFVAMAVMQQVERGKLSLDAHVADLAPELNLKNKWEETHPVRVVNLVEHTAGFDDMHYRNWLARSASPVSEAVLDLDAELVSRWQPDQWHAYSNPGYEVAAYLVEKASGMSFEDYVDQELLGPLGMQDTFWKREQAEPTLATGFTGSGKPVAWQQLKLAATGALISTPRDMAKLAAYLVSRGETVPGLLEASSLERLERAETTASARAGLTFAYGMGNYTRQVNNLAFHGHDGSLPGYLSTVLYSRDHDVALVVMVASSEYGVFSKVRKLAADYLLRDTPLPPEGAYDDGAVVDPANSGFYYPANPPNSLWGGMARTMNGAKLTAKGDRYTFAPPIMPWAAIEYFPMPGGQIRDSGKAMATGVFLQDAEGRPAFTDIDTAYVRGAWWNVALPQYLVVAAIVLMLSTLIFALVWLPRLAFGGLRSSTHIWTRALPLLATVVFIAAIATAIQFRLEDMLGLNFKTLAFSLLGWLFGLLGLVGLVQSVRTFRAQSSRIVAVHSLLASVAVAGLAIWLLSIGLLGIQLWAW